jgi:hypothetical protein
MKQMKKYIFVMVTMLMVSMGASAQTANIIYQLDGVVQNEISKPGTVNVDFSTHTITVTPGSGNYLTADDLEVVKVVDGSKANTRSDEPGFNKPVSITAKDANANPSTTTVYNFAELKDENYGLEVTANFHTRISISDATVSGLAASYTYTGEAIKPVVTVKVGDNTLTLGTDYRAVYTDSINASTDAVKGKIALSGLRKYTGTQVVEYTIAKADPTLTFEPESATYTFGQSFTKPVLTTDPEGLTVTYTSSNQGVAEVGETTGDITAKAASAEAITITASFAGNDNYNAKNATYSLTVAKGTAVVTVEPEAKDNLTYNGNDQELLVTAGTATNGEMMYRIGTEGDFSEDIPKGNAAGQYTVYYKAVAINPDQFNDSEALSITATINPKSITNATISLTQESFTYNGQEQKPEEEDVSVKDGEMDLVLDQDYTLTNEGGTNAGEYTVTITGKLNYTGDASKKFNITALETTPTVTLTETSFVYDGTEKKPAVTVTVVLPGASASTELTTNDYDVVYSDNVNAGENTAKATVTLKRNYVGQNTATFTIAPKAVTITAKDDVKEFDNTPLTQSGFTATALEPGDTHTFTVVMTDQSSITNPGTQPNVIATVDGVAVTTGTATPVGNYLVTTANGTLTITKNAVEAVIAKINSIGTVAYTDACKALIDDARTAYNALTDAQKALVTNYSTLTTAETTYATLKAEAEALAADQAAVDAVIAKINAIGTVENTDACKALIDDTRTAYNALTDAQKKLLPDNDLWTLERAEEKYVELVKEQKAAEEQAADQAAANAVITKIDAIGTVEYTDACKALIDDARTAYNALNDAQKALVTNATTLINAETTYADLKAQAEAEPLTPTITKAPTAKTNLVCIIQNNIYSSQELIEPGSVENGTMYYRCIAAPGDKDDKGGKGDKGDKGYKSDIGATGGDKGDKGANDNTTIVVDGIEWSRAIPTGDVPGKYKVAYMVKGDEGYEDIAEQTLTVTIAKAKPTITKAPTAKTNLEFKCAKAGGETIHDLIEPGYVVNGTMYYRYVSIPNYFSGEDGKNGIYGIYGDTGSKNGLTGATGKKVDKDGTGATGDKGITGATGTIGLIDATGATVDVNGPWETDIPTGAFPGKYTIAYMVKGDEGYEDIAEQTLTVTIYTNVDYKELEDGTVAITGPKKNADGTYSSAYNENVIPIPVAVDGKLVSRIENNAFEDIVNKILQLTGGKINIGNGAMGDNLVQTNPEDITDYSKQEGLQETLKAGNLFTTIPTGFKYQTFACGIDLVIPKEYNPIIKGLGVIISQYIQIYTCNVKEKADKTGLEVVTTLIPEKDLKVNEEWTLKRNNGVIIYWDDQKLEEMKTKYGNNMYVAPLIAQFTKDAETAADGVKNDYKPNMLEPVLKKQNYKSNEQFAYYLLYEGEFHLIVNNDSETPACKALLKVPTSMVKTAAAARTLTIRMEDDEATGIVSNGLTRTDTDQDRWYTISGQRIQRPTKKGLYIHNGVKEVVK